MVVRKSILVVVMTAMCAAVPAFADDAEEYRLFVEDTRNAVYSMELPAFEVREIPEKYKNESAVVIAAYHELDARKKTGFGRVPGSLRFTRKAQVEGGELSRMLIHINDKAALDKFSEFDFATDMKKKMSDAHRKQRHVMGVRVIKPDGRIVDVNTDDFVEVEEGKNGKEKRRKLAVPGLEVGDDIDVFFYTEHKLQNVHLEPMTFCLRDEYPILDYRIHAVVDDKLTTQYRTLNGAPDFTVSRDEDNNYVLDMHVSDIPAEPRLWYNDSEQSPMVKLHVYNRRSDQYTPQSARRKDGLQANPAVGDILDDFWLEWRGSSSVYAPIFVKDAMKGGGKVLKALKNRLKSGQADSTEVSDYVYNLITFAYLASGNDMYPERFVDRFEGYLVQLGFKEHVAYSQLITSSVDDEPIDSLVSMFNASQGLALAGGRRHYLPPLSIMAPSELQPAYIGRKARRYCDAKYLKKHPGIDTALFRLPESSPIDNRNVTELKVEIEGTTLDVNRRESCLGSTKRPVMSLLTEEDVFEAFLTFLNRDGIEVALKENDKKAGDRAERYADARRDRIDDFKDEISSYHGDATTEFIDGSIVSVGIDPDSPELVYDLHYTVDGLLKRAGKNFVLSIGRLLSRQTELLPSDMDRVDDVVMTSPREFVTRISVGLPSGVSVSQKSLGALCRSVDNAAGTFKVVAAQNGSRLDVEVTKCYKHRREPASAWTELADVLDAAASWQSATVLLEK